VSTDPNRSKRLEHWQAIADQLGLSETPGSPPSEPGAKSSAPVEEDEPTFTAPRPAARPPAEFDDAALEAPAARDEYATEDSPPAFGAEEEKVEVEARREKRRGRGEPRGRRGRKERRPPVEEEMEAAEREQAEDTVEEPEPELEEEDDSDDDDLSLSYQNWTVPSWNDLIASLYRPER